MGKKEDPRNTGIHVEEFEHPEVSSLREAEKLYWEMRKNKREEGLENNSLVKKRVYQSVRERLARADSIGRKIEELEKLGYERVFIRGGGTGQKSVSLREAHGTGRERYILGMYQRTLKDVQGLVDNPDKDSKLAKRILERED